MSARDIIQINTILDGKVKIYQNNDAFKVSIDSILAYSSINLPNSKTFNILDVGCGNGGILLSLASKYKYANITGIDVQENQLDLLEKSIKENEFNNINIIKEDIFNTKEIHKDSFDYVVTNPPYYKGMTSSNSSLAKSNSEINFDLEKWIKYSLKRVKARGYFSIIHKASRLDDIIYSLKKNSMGGIEIFLLESKKNTIVNRVIVRAQKGVKTETTIYPSITLHNNYGSYTKQANMILRDGLSIDEVTKSLSS